MSFRRAVLMKGTESGGGSSPLVLYDYMKFVGDGTGNAYFKSGLYPALNRKYEVKACRSTNTNWWLFGCATTTAANRRHGIYYSGNSNLYCYFQSASWNPANFGSNAVRTITVDLPNSYMEMTNTSGAIVTSKSDVVPYVYSAVQAKEMYICAYNYTSGAAGHMKSNARFYYLKVWEDGVLIRHWQPCIYEGEIGLWEHCSNTFLPNSGSSEYLELYNE